MPMWLYFFVMYFCGVWAFSSSRKHLLITLLSLEFIVLVLYISMYFYLCNFNYSLFFVVYFLVFSVCEGSLGLSILVSMIRSHGNDYFQSYSVLQC
uniref:NADH-ubiquinone oxidoreductase chain 4L n=1 Tax=Apicotermes occultus TaxID=2854083 RepID=A0A8F6U3E0_9NEOP|nr:NADH dehydrogenase subunit 4L [Apicotermes occultus]